MNRKVVFLDIDGTLVDFRTRMPDSAREALKKARENGHLLSLCTGRTASNIYDWLLDFGFDAIVASAGAYVKMGDTVIYHSTLDAKEVARLTDIIADHGASCMVQGIDGLYMEKEHEVHMRQYCAKQGLDLSAVLQRLEIVEHPYLMPNLESGVYYGADIPVDKMQKEAGSYFKITGASFGKDRQMSGEMTRMGVNKATGMQHLLDYLHMDRADSIAIGDGPNDVEMLSYAGISVAMGNAMEGIKQYADMVTDDIDKDGIYKAFEKLGLLDG